MVPNQTSVLFFVFFFVTPSLATSDYVKKVDRIEEVCKSIKVPNLSNLCISTLRSNPRSSGANIKGLALILLEATIAKAKDNIALIKKLIASSRTDPVIEGYLNNCSDKYHSGIEDLSLAMHVLVVNDIFGAISLIGFAGDSGILCEVPFHEPPHERPSPLTLNNEVFGQLSIVSEQVVNLLTSS